MPINNRIAARCGIDLVSNVLFMLNHFVGSKAVFGKNHTKVVHFSLIDTLQMLIKTEKNAERSHLVQNEGFSQRQLMFVYTSFGIYSERWGKLSTVVGHKTKELSINKVYI